MGTDDTPSPLRWTASILLASTLVLAACGGNDDAPADAAGGSATADDGDGAGEGQGQGASGDDVSAALCDPPVDTITAAVEEPAAVEGVDAGTRYRCQYVDGDGAPFFEVTYEDGLDALTASAVADPDRFQDRGNGIYLENDGYRLLAAHRAGGVVQLTLDFQREAPEPDLLLAIGLVAIDAAEAFGAAQGVELAAPDLDAIGGGDDPDAGGGDATDVDLDTACDALDAEVIGDVLGTEIAEIEPKVREQISQVRCDLIGPDLSGGLYNHVLLDFSGGFSFGWDERPDEGEARFDGIETGAFLRPGVDREPSSILDVRAGVDSTVGARVSVETYDTIDAVRTELADDQWLALGEHVLKALRSLV